MMKKASEEQKINITSLLLLRLNTVKRGVEESEFVGKRSREKRRIEVITLFEKGGLTPVQIVEATGYPTRTVYEWIKKHKEGRPTHDLPRSGRPKKVTPAIRKRIITLTRGKRGRSTRKVAALMQKEGVEVCPSTVRNHLRVAGLVPHRQVKRARLSVAQKRKRVLFAKKYLRHDWAHTLITDEKHFSTFAPPNPRNDVIWDQKGVEYVAEVMSYPPQARFWGGISSCGKTSLYKYEGTIDSEKYIGIIRQAVPEIKAMFRGTPFYFQQDGASAHRSKQTTEYLHKTFNHVIGAHEWPANSPDLSPIENLWGIIDAKVKAEDPKTVQRLETLVVREWNAVSDEIVENLMVSMSARLQQCIENHGNWVAY
jgi:transposase